MGFEGWKEELTRELNIQGVKPFINQTKGQKNQQPRLLCGPTEQMQQLLARYPRFQTRTGGIDADDAAAVEIGKTILIKGAHSTDAGWKAGRIMQCRGRQQ